MYYVVSYFFQNRLVTLIYYKPFLIIKIFKILRNHFKTIESLD